jgi:hypothetical protein
MGGRAEGLGRIAVEALRAHVYVHVLSKLVSQAPIKWSGWYNKGTGLSTMVERLLTGHVRTPRTRAARGRAGGCAGTGTGAGAGSGDSLTPRQPLARTPFLRRTRAVNGVPDASGSSSAGCTQHSGMAPNGSV